MPNCSRVEFDTIQWKFYQTHSNQIRDPSSFSYHYTYNYEKIILKREKI